MRSGVVLVGGWLAAWAGMPAVASAHGVVTAPSSLWEAALAWTFEAHVLLPLTLAAVAYWSAVRSVARAHPRTRVPRWRAGCWYGGLAVLVVALCSPIATYDTTLFSAHMVQHLLLMLVAAPLLALGAPITLLLRVAGPDVRRRFILPVLHSRVVRLVAHPVVAWVVFAAVMYVSHFGPLFDAALHDEALHVLEHGLYLGAAMLFWWPVVGADPSPWRLPHPARIGYLFLGMPWSSFLGLVIFSAPSALYPHYSTLARTWGPTPLADQQLAGGVMWVVGDGVFLVAMLLAVWVWMRAEEREGLRVDARLEREAAAAAAARADAVTGRATR